VICLFAEPKNPTLVFALTKDESKRRVFLFAGRFRKPELAVEQTGFPRAHRRHKKSSKVVRESETGGNGFGQQN